MKERLRRLRRRVAECPRRRKLAALLTTAATAVAGIVTVRRLKK